MDNPVPSTRNAGAMPTASKKTGTNACCLRTTLATRCMEAALEDSRYAISCGSPPSAANSPSLAAGTCGRRRGRCRHREHPSASESPSPSRRVATSASRQPSYSPPYRRSEAARSASSCKAPQRSYCARRFRRRLSRTSRRVAPASTPPDWPCRGRTAMGSSTWDSAT